MSEVEVARWDLPMPFIWEIDVQPADIDFYNHVNNSVYVTWFERAAWEHSGSVGLPVASCLSLDRGMAVIRSTIVYARAALLGDTIRVATWIVSVSGKIRVRRRFQVKRASDDVTLARAELDYVCLQLSNGRPARWPSVFRERYVTADEIVSAYAGLAPL